MMMLRSTVAQVLRRWRSQYRSANHIDVVHLTPVIERFSDSNGGYVLGGLATKSISEDDRRTEQIAINLHRYMDKSERVIQKLEMSDRNRE